MYKQLEAILSSMEANAAGATQVVILPSEPDTSRPTVSTAVAAARCGLSRYYMAELVRQGKIDGYGVRRHDGGRVRWYVYADALPHRSGEGDEVRSSREADELLRHLLKAREHERLSREERDHAQGLLMDASDALTAALRATTAGNPGGATERLLLAQEMQNDVMRRLLSAQRHEADAEAFLDAAVRSFLPPGKEIESHARGSAASAPAEEITARGMP